METRSRSSHAVAHGLAQAIRTAGLLERGHSNSPLSDHLKAIAGQHEIQRIGLLVVSDSIRRREIVQAICERFAEPVLSAHNTSDLVVATLGEMGASGTAVNRRRGPGAQTYIELALPGTAAVSNLTVAFSDTQALAKSGILQMAATLSSVLIVALDPGVALGAVEAARLRELQQLMTSVISLAPAPAMEGPTQLGGQAAQILDRTSSAREAFSSLETARQLLMTQDLILEQINSEAQRLIAQHNVATRRLRHVEGMGQASSQARLSGTQRTAIDEAWSRINAEINDRLKRSFHHSEPLLKSLFDRIDALTWEDMHKENKGSGIAVTLSEDYLNELQHDLQRAVRKVLQEIVGEVNRLLQGLCTTFLSTTEDPQQWTGISLGTDAARELRDAVTEYIEIEVNYKSEAPKRSFINRIDEGKRGISIAMMFFMLFPTNILTEKVLPWMFAKWESLPGREDEWIVRLGLIGPILLLKVLSTYFIWPRVDREREEKELERAREQLIREMRSDLSSLQRDTQSRLSTQLGYIKQQLYKAVETGGFAVAGKTAVTLEAERKAIRQRIGILEQRIKEWRELEQLARKQRDETKETVRSAQETASGISATLTGAVR